MNQLFPDTWYKLSDWLQTYYWWVAAGGLVLLLLGALLIRYDRRTDADERRTLSSEDRNPHIADLPAADDPALVPPPMSRAEADAIVGELKQIRQVLLDLSNHLKGFG